MSPFQHGEVYVLDDGAETDLDLGHYERFTNCLLTRLNNLTSGQVYQRSSSRNAAGTIWARPCRSFRMSPTRLRTASKLPAETKADVIITEIGGTTGDIEGLPFLEAIRQFALEVGTDNAMFLHVTGALHQGRGRAEDEAHPAIRREAARNRTAPTILVCRCEKPLDKELRQKISMFCNVPYEAVIEGKTSTTAFTKCR